MNLIDTQVLGDWEPPGETFDEGVDNFVSVLEAMDAALTSLFAMFFDMRVKKFETLALGPVSPERSNLPEAVSGSYQAGITMIRHTQASPEALNSGTILKTCGRE